jgi:hypothetical protein
MKKRMLYYIATAVLLLLCGTQMTNAQSMQRLLTVQIPFDFHAGGKLLPAGEYTIRRMPSTVPVLVIEDAGRSVGVMVLASQFAPSEAQTVLTFNEYGAQRFLAEVRIGPTGFKYALTKSKAERRLARTMAAHISTNSNGSTADRR